MTHKLFRLLIPGLLCLFLSGCGGGDEIVLNMSLQDPAGPIPVEVPSEPPPPEISAEPIPEETLSPPPPPSPPPPSPPPPPDCPSLVLDPKTLTDPVSQQSYEISIPEGFSISFYSNQISGARSLALGTNGTLFVGTRSLGTVYALSDTDGDNYAETVRVIADNLNTPNGVAFRNGDLYVAERNRIVRYDEIESRLSSPPAPAVVIDMLPGGASHWWKFLRFGPDGKLYVPVGAPCNVCKESDERYAAILRMNPDGSSPEVFAHGVRNTVGFDWHPGSGELWFTDNGRDNISNDQQITDNSPPDELNRAGGAGLHFGFPYCHGTDVSDPDFGSMRACSEFTPPELELPAHVAALGMRFYTGSMFPAPYKNSIFIAEHGSWNRSTPIGYRVTLACPGPGKEVSYQVFAQGWLKSDGTAWGRPVDVLVAPDGALLVSDDRRGAIYRISR